MKSNSNIYNNFHTIRLFDTLSRIFHAINRAESALTGIGTFQLSFASF